MKFLLSITLAALALAVCGASKPVIGILTTPSDIDGYPHDDYSYLPDSYVNYLEDVGALIVPIPYDASPENITFLLSKVNGLLLPGGNEDLNRTDANGKIQPTPFVKAAGFVLSKALEINKNGTHFPIFNICQGFEIFLMYITENYDLLVNSYKEIDVNNKLNFAKDSEESKMWKGLSNSLLKAVSSDDVFYFHLQFALPLSKFETTEKLKNLLTVTSTANPKKGGQEFVTSYEGKDLPIYAIAFHPEKSGFVHRKEVNVSHSEDSIKASQFLAKTFVESAKKNTHKFEPQSLLEASLVTNWMSTTNTEYYDKAYLFENVEKNKWMYPNLYHRY